MNQNDLRKFGIDTPIELPEDIKVRVEQLDPYDRYKLSKQMKIRRLNKSQITDLSLLRIP